MTSGYSHQLYAESLAEFGEPIELPNAHGWLLRRRIPNSEYVDARGCYPLFACRDWSKLGKDLGTLREGLVSVALVCDPFGDHNEQLLRETFDCVVAFKSHYIVELGKPPAELVSKHHRYYARKALAKVSVSLVADKPGFLPEWCALYSNLIRRHDLKGIKAFSPRSFGFQFEMQDMLVFRAFHHGRTVGAHLWVLEGGVANSHLAAFSEEGYELMCAYALYWEAITFFTGKVHYLNIGAGAGLEADSADGLNRFKRGWSTASRTAWFCTSVLQPDRYRSLCALAIDAEPSFFPAYRAGLS